MGTSAGALHTHARGMHSAIVDQSALLSMCRALHRWAVGATVLDQARARLVSAANQHVCAMDQADPPLLNAPEFPDDLLGEGQISTAEPNPEDASCQPSDHAAQRDPNLLGRNAFEAASALLETSANWLKDETGQYSSVVR